MYSEHVSLNVGNVFARHGLDAIWTDKGRAHDRNVFNVKRNPSRQSKFYTTRCRTPTGGKFVTIDLYISCGLLLRLGCTKRNSLWRPPSKIVMQVRLQPAHPVVMVTRVRVVSAIVAMLPGVRVLDTDVMHRDLVVHASIVHQAIVLVGLCLHVNFVQMGVNVIAQMSSNKCAVHVAVAAVAFQIFITVFAAESVLRNMEMSIAQLRVIVEVSVLLDEVLVILLIIEVVLERVAVLEISFVVRMRGIVQLVAHVVQVHELRGLDGGRRDGQGDDDNTCGLHLGNMRSL